jgi:hypothetical protein
MLAFYMKKTFVDPDPGIDLVKIHYTWTPLGETPDWGAHCETRLLPRGGVLLRGMGGTTLDDAGQYVQTVSQRIELPDDGVRRKVLRLPTAVFDPATGRYTDTYALHHYFEAFRHGTRERSAVYTEEIVSKEVEFVDLQGHAGGLCLFWSIQDWDAPQYQPTEEPRIIERFGEDTPYRSHKFYGAEDKETFSRTRSEMLRALPPPRRFVGKIHSPKGAQVHQSWHMGGMWSANVAERWETYWGYVIHTL